MLVEFKKTWPHEAKSFKKGERANLSFADAKTAVDGGFADYAKENKKAPIKAEKAVK